MGDKINILLVDDSVRVVKAVTSMLHRLPNVNHIMVANTISESQIILKKEHIDVVILDIHLPDGNGLGLLNWIKNNYPHIVVVIFSNESYQMLRATAWEYGARFFVDKTKEFEKLPSILAALKNHK